jgi:single-stranded-DNA-specific exonuclease
LNALESSSHLFTRFGGHAHAVGFSLPSGNVAGLRTQLDAYARERLTLADFEQSMKIDAEIPLDQVTPELFRSVCRLEPFGVGNPEPVFAAREVRLMTPPRVIKDKHIKLRVAGSSRNGDCRKSVAFNALGWNMAEKFQQSQIIPGDTFDIAFTLDHNEHPDFGGLELSLKDFQAK